MTSTVFGSGLDVRVDTARPPIVLSDIDNAVEWIGRHHRDVHRALSEYGCLLVRGLRPLDAADMTAVLESLGVEPMADREPFAVRRTLGHGTYSSTVWPAAQRMCMHHEASYALDVPSIMVFACRIAPARGGATPLADGAAVLASLPGELVDRVSREGWILDRAFTSGIGASVAECFGTDTPAAVQEYCRANGIDVRWSSDVLHTSVLRTSQRRPGVVRHPTTGLTTWFNQLAFLSEWTMDAEVRDFLVDTYGADALPFTTRYGDGTPIDAQVVDAIGAVYDSHTIREPWHSGDLLVIDNIRTAHGRDPYTGDREILVGMGGPMRHVGIGAQA